MGTVSAVSLGTAVARGGTTTAGSGWRAPMLAATPCWSYARSAGVRAVDLVEQGAGLGAVVGVFGAQQQAQICPVA